MEVYREDTTSPGSSKKKSSGARSARRAWLHNKRNQPKFGPLNGWEVDPKPVVVNRRALMYGGY
jgi:hypothetical protein